MKKCPFCAEEIQDEAIKCKHCGEFLNRVPPPPVPRTKGPWYFNTTVIIIALLSVGPLALPMIWWHPKMKAPAKIGITVGVIVLTWMLYQTMVWSLQNLQRQLDALKGY